MAGWPHVEIPIVVHLGNRKLGVKRGGVDCWAEVQTNL